MFKTAPFGKGQVFALTAPDLRQSQSILTQEVQPANVFAETEPLETDVAFVSKAVTQAAKAANDLLNFCDFCIIRSYCLGKRLDAIFESGYTLLEWRQF